MGRPKKIQSLKLQKYKNTGGSLSWRVTGMMPDGRRIRKNFKEKSDALVCLSDCELEIEARPEPRKSLRTLLTPEELADAESARQELGSSRTLTQTITHHLNLEKQAAEKGCNLDEAISFFRSHFRKETTEITILNAQNEFLGTRPDISDKTHQNYESGLKLLMVGDPNKLVHTFSVTDLESILGRYPNIHTRRSFRIIFAAFFNWAVRHHYCLENPCDRLEKLPQDLSKISILSLDESKRLLRAAMLLQDGAAASSVAIGLFAGLRPSEIRDLKPNDIRKGKLRVAGGKMRRKLKRSVPIPPILAQWLEEYPFTGQPDGWDYKMKTLKKATKAKKWVQDIIRHTSISFQVERDQNEGLTVMNCGTSMQMMNRHYREIIDDDETVNEFWSLKPDMVRRLDLKVDVPSTKKVRWPSNTKLKTMVWDKPLIHVGPTLGVSDVALRKHCKKNGIELPPMGYWLKKN